MATNHGVGGSNPSSPTTQRESFAFGGRKIMHDRDSGPKAMELGCGSFVEIEWLFLSRE